jgi:hypothetical protein
MSMGEEQSRLSCVRSVLASCGRLAFGPFSDEPPLDRVATGAAAGVLVLAAIAVPVTIASVARSHIVPSWVVALCIGVGILAGALLIKSCQRPVTDNKKADTAREVSRGPSAIDISRSMITKSEIDIPEGSRASVADSTLNESPLRIRRSAPLAKRKLDKK